jgi:hypothetical protein
MTDSEKKFLGQPIIAAWQKKSEEFYIPRLSATPAYRANTAQLYSSAPGQSAP